MREHGGRAHSRARANVSVRFSLDVKTISLRCRPLLATDGGFRRANLRSNLVIARQQKNREGGGQRLDHPGVELSSGSL
jgi:hypothetical protein